MPWDDDLDAASMLVPVDVANIAGVLQSITSNGAEIPEDPNPAWSSSTTYNAIGQRVYLASTHRVYENLKTDGTNLNKDPSVVANRINVQGVGTYWQEVGPTNKYAAFDGKITTQLSAPSPLVIRLTPGAFNGFALFGIDADSYSVTVKDAPGGNVIYSEPTTPLEGSMPGDYYEYLFDRFKPLTQFIRTGIEPYGSSEITLTLNKGSGNVKLGMFALGDMQPIGIPQRDASVEPMDHSSIVTDAYGETAIRKRPNSTGMTISCIMEQSDANSVLAAVRQVLGTPVVVVGSQAALFEWMTVFGLVSARIAPVPYPYCTIYITVKGLI